MRNAGLEEAQAGIKIAGRNINNVSYADDTTIMAEEDITIVNRYAPNIGALQYVKQMLTSMKGEINSNTIIVGDFKTPLTPMDRSAKHN